MKRNIATAVMAGVIGLTSTTSCAAFYNKTATNKSSYTWPAIYGEGLYTDLITNCNYVTFRNPNPPNSYPETKANITKITCFTFPNYVELITVYTDNNNRPHHFERELFESEVIRDEKGHFKGTKREEGSCIGRDLSIQHGELTRDIGDVICDPRKYVKRR